MEIKNSEKCKILCWNDLTKEEKSDFDHYRKPDTDASFFRYRNNCYDINDMMPTSEEGWQFAEHATIFWGIVCKFAEDDYDDFHIVCAQYSC